MDYNKEILYIYRLVFEKCVQYCFTARFGHPVDIVDALPFVILQANYFVGQIDLKMWKEQFNSFQCDTFFLPKYEDSSITSSLYCNSLPSCPWINLNYVFEDNRLNEMKINLDTLTYITADSQYNYKTTTMLKTDRS